ncbi:Radial spoke head protein 9 [Gaertneriomyces sp. JEL0708]|nr:Radial spoke head protein 9 [Gaertneriomyces sp. JEL0708]
MSYLKLEDISYLSLAGFTLNPEERTALESSLLLKQNEEKLNHVSLWGKILGIQRDYYIAQATNNENVFARKYFYSVDLINWLQLPEVAPKDVQTLSKVQTRFTGDPAFEYQVAFGEGTEEGAEGTGINEEKRLAVAIALISYEVEIVPRAAYVRDMTRQIQPNPAFKGVPKGEVGQLTSYLHFREGFDINKKTLMDRAHAFDESVDVFESISDDQPKGVWSVQTEGTGSIAIVRNLMWPGYTFFHSPDGPKWGSIYYGSGQRNNSLGFML